MAHSIEYYTYPYETSTAKIMTEMNEKAASCGDAGGLYYPIRFETRTPFEDEEAAETYIKSIDRSYLSVAVPYYVYNRADIPEPKSLITARDKEREASMVLKARKQKQYYTTESVASKTIGCKECGSKLAVGYLTGNLCPVCRAELRPESELKRIDALAEHLIKARATLANEEMKYHAKVREKGEASIKWLVKIEYHC